MPNPLYTLTKNPWYPLDRILGRPQSQSGCCEMFFTLARFQIMIAWYSIIVTSEKINFILSDRPVTLTCRP
jgi:hypothetical protein